MLVSDLLSRLNGSGSLARVTELTADAEAAALGRQDANEGVYANIISEFRASLGSGVTTATAAAVPNSDNDTIYYVENLEQVVIDGHAVAHIADMSMSLTFTTSSSMNSMIEGLNDTASNRPTVSLTSLSVTEGQRGHADQFILETKYSVILPALADMKASKLEQDGQYALCYELDQTGYGARYDNVRGEVIETEFVVFSFSLDGSKDLRDGVVDRLIGWTPSDYFDQVSLVTTDIEPVISATKIRVDRMIFSTKQINYGD